jgi:primosomal protein N' (replication factor Y)
MKSMSKEKPIKYAIEVIPIIPLPLLREPSFTYEFPESIEEGSLVRIPFGKRTLRGIVASASEMRKSLPFKTRLVCTIITPSALSPGQMELARYIADTSLAPLGIVLKHFLPKQTIERRKRDTKQESLAPLPRLSTSRQKILTALSKGSRHHFLPASLEEKISIFLSLAQKTLRKKNEQLLILVPDILLAREYLETFEKHFETQHLALISSTLSAGAQHTAWEAIHSGNARIIIGTRQALFAPFGNLHAILLDFDGHDGYKQWDMMPRYDGRSVAEHLAKLHEANFITVSPGKSLRVIAEQEAGGFPIHGETIFANKRLKDTIILSDLKLDRYKKNFTPFSHLTLEHIRETRSRGERILLIVNRQGTSIFSVCERCKEVLRCPNCERALVGTKTESYRCLHCSYHTKEFPTCPGCGSLHFKNVGFGTEKLERDLKRTFTHARIRRLDATSRRVKQDAGDILTEAHAGNIDMLIGTEAALLAPAIPRLGLIVLLDGDNALRFPDYQAEERLLRTLAIALARREGGTPNAKLIIQTFHSEHALFRALTGGTMDTFIDTLLHNRRLFSYPPYGTIIQCSVEAGDGSCCP